MNELSENVHNFSESKVEENENGAKLTGNNSKNIGNGDKQVGSWENGKEDGITKANLDKKTVDPSSNMLQDQEPLFIDMNSKDYLSKDHSTLPEEDRNKISWDEVLAIFLYEASKKVNSEYYLTMIRFVLAYRECLNKYGWEKKAENDEVLNNGANGEELETTMITPASEGVQEKAKELKKKANGVEFSVINNAEHAPEICNEFVTVFLQDKKDINLQKNESIDLTRNICHWLFTESYTCSKVSMIKS